MLNMFRKKNPFRVKLQSLKSEDKVLEDATFAFSERLKRAMGLSVEEIEQMDRDRVTFTIGDRWIVFARNTILSDGWQHLLMVSTIATGDSIGWSNVEHQSLPESWQYKPDGTGTLALPPESVQQIILDDIKQMFVYEGTE